MCLSSPQTTPPRFFNWINRKELEPGRWEIPSGSYFLWRIQLQFLVDSLRSVFLNVLFQSILCIDWFWHRNTAEFFKHVVLCIWISTILKRKKIETHWKWKLCLRLAQFSSLHQQTASRQRGRPERVDGGAEAFQRLVIINVEVDEIFRLRGKKKRGGVGAQRSFVFHTKCEV